jgi:hypothetical protein
MPYAIYPPLGFARLGNSPAFFLGPEAPNSLGIEIDQQGKEQAVTRFKDDAYRVKRKGVRFHIFELKEGQPPAPAVLPAGAVVRWRINVANRKDAIHRPSQPPSHHQPVEDDPNRQDRVISASAEIAGVGAPPAGLDGHYQGTAVHLGDVLTDGAQRLIFLGGRGYSATLAVPPASIGGSFYSNPDWFDDVCDGSVEATILLPGGPPVEAAGAWVVVAPPDFAPPAQGVVTLFDVIRQVALDQGWVPPTVTPWFDSDIRPMIDRASRLRWVDPSDTWSAISTDWAALADPSPAQAALRQQTVDLLREVENALNDFTLRDWQGAVLNAYAAGTFQPGTAPDRGACDKLTRTALDETVGQGFFPGIEAGINLTDPQLYAAPFEYRFRVNALRPGDATAHMAQPWQADFLKCGAGWWPAQRPVVVAQPGGGSEQWLRPNMTHAELVDKAMQLGIATPDGAGNVVEQGRDPVLGP